MTFSTRFAQAARQEQTSRDTPQRHRETERRWPSNLQEMRETTSADQDNQPNQGAVRMPSMRRSLGAKD